MNLCPAESLTLTDDTGGRATCELHRHHLGDHVDPYGRTWGPEDTAR